MEQVRTVLCTLSRSEHDRGFLNAAKFVKKKQVQKHATGDPLLLLAVMFRPDRFVTIDYPVSSAIGAELVFWSSQTE